jgi:NAD(P)-dependent dehydrogenase (short-subunit alcohol dehydrogenase family)
MPLSRSLSDSVVVLTGASSGIGAATAALLARRGTTVVLAGRRVDPLVGVARRCRDLGGQALVVPTDVTDPDAVERLAERAVAGYGHLDGWVNNAAVGLYAPLPDAPLDDLRRVLEVNLLGYLYGVRAAIPRMRESGGGVLVNNASVLGTVTVPNMGAYTIAKHGVLALSATLRQDLRLAGDTGISVCTCLPASVDTPFYRHAANYTGRQPRPIPPVYPPDVAARTIVGLLRRPRRQAYAGGAGRILAAQWRHLPGLTEWIMTRYAGRTQFVHRAAPVGPGNVHAPLIDHPSYLPAVDDGWHGRRAAAVRRTVAAAAGAAGALATAAVVRHMRH